MKILAFAGSLRKNSYNLQALELAKSLAPENIEIEIFPLNDMPFMNEDLEDNGFPEIVKQLRGKVEQADAVLISTPEYNNSYSSITKNAIEWLSRSPSVARGKKLGIMGASDGDFGAVRALLLLRALASVVGFDLDDNHVVAIPNADVVFEHDQKERLIKHINSLLDSLSSD
ncbi:NAD(P)H-dependent oxidoreductase [Candidatus Dojkabacteria bacterium]|uniref:NAD(P)H-dependent oxidoreductase n=1 Tax=Candidatus Dojkabacteria bacterium TaxID=2099670 RepID=A0A955L6P2_9BACT|nr:NAD(P)H-dependent oxidoreductase [Candidatus Dojkabacteria bacterium]